jgi:hypothetical protein
MTYKGIFFIDGADLSIVRSICFIDNGACLIDKGVCWIFSDLFDFVRTSLVGKMPVKLLSFYAGIKRL